MLWDLVNNPPDMYIVWGKHQYSINLASLVQVTGKVDACLRLASAHLPEQGPSLSKAEFIKFSLLVVSIGYTKFTHGNLNLVPWIVSEAFIDK